MLLEVLITLATVAGVLVAVELAFSSFVPQLSANSRSLAKNPERAERILGAGDKPTVLLLGNSMGREGIDEDLLEELMRGAGLDAVVEHQPADASIPRDWYYQLKNHYVERGAVPDVVVLPVGDGRPFVRTKRPIEDLMYTFLVREDLGDFFEYSEMDSFDDRSEVVLGFTSAMYCFRGRFQKRILTEIDPGYEGLRGAMNVTSAQGGGEAKAPPSNRNWVELIDKITRENGSSVVVIPMPTRALEGRLPDSDRAIAREFGWHLVEPADGVRFPDDEIPDGLHLTAPARERFTEMLTPPLAAAITKSLAERPGKP